LLNNAFVNFELWLGLFRRELGAGVSPPSFSGGWPSRRGLAGNQPRRSMARVTRFGILLKPLLGLSTLSSLQQFEPRFQTLPAYLINSFSFTLHSGK